MNTNFVMIANRTKEAIEFQFDGRVYIIPALKTVPLMEDVARHGVLKTRFGLNLGTGDYQYRLAIEGEGDTSPLEKEPSKDELIDREASGPEFKAQKKKFSNPDLNISRAIGPF